MGNWKAAARKTLVGEKRYFDTMPLEEGETERFWMRPRKFSIEAQDAIAQAQYKLRDRIGADALKILTEHKDVIKRAQDAAVEKGEELSNEEVFELLSADELETVVRGVPPSERYELAKLELLYGWHDDNFGREEGATQEQFIEDVLDFPDLAREALEFVEEWNRPLLDTIVRTFGTASSGPTTDTSSPKEPESSPTAKSRTDSSGNGDPG